MRKELKYLFVVLFIIIGVMNIRAFIYEKHAINLIVGLYMFYASYRDLQEIRDENKEESE